MQSNKRQRTEAEVLRDQPDAEEVAKLFCNSFNDLYYCSTFDTDARSTLIDGDTCEALGRLVSRGDLPYFKELTFNGPNEDLLFVFVKAVDTCAPSIRKLNLKCFGWEDPSVVRSLSIALKQKMFRGMASFAVDDNLHTEIIDSFSKTGFTTNLDDLVGSLSEHTQLRRVQMTQVMLGSEGVECLVAHLNKFHCLEELDISCNDIGDKGDIGDHGLCMLVDAFCDGAVPALKVLDIGGNCVTSVGLNALADALESGALKELEKLNVGGMFETDDPAAFEDAEKRLQQVMARRLDPLGEPDNSDSDEEERPPIRDDM